MWNVCWRHRATILLVFALATIVFGGSGGPTLEQDCELARVINSNGLAYFCLIAAHAFTGTTVRSLSKEGSGVPLAFEANLGQAESQYEYLARSTGGSVYLSKGSATLDLRETKGARAVRASFAGANSRPEAVVENPLPGHVNYILDKNPQNWITDVPTFSRIRYKNVYPGIDVVYYGASGTLEHDVIVNPGAKPESVELLFDGSDDVALEKGGSAVVRAGGRTVEWKKPVIYQQVNGHRVAVEGQYRQIRRGQIGFEVGAYDTTRPLVIDPVVSYVSYNGRSAAEGGSRVAFDSQGNTYVSGYSDDSSYPITPGAYNPDSGAGNTGNGVIVKYNAANTAVVYTTYIGGQTWDAFSGVAVDSAGNAYLAGVTDSDNYPVTAGALKTKLHNAASETYWNCVVTKLNPAGNALVYSTYLGGPGSAGCTGIAVDGQGNAYLTGAESDFGFPLSDNAPFRIPRGAMDAFVVKLNPAGSQIVYGTLLGGADVDSGFGIATDSRGAAYITGQTASTQATFPVSSNAFQKTLAGVSNQSAARFGDAFVAKLSPDGGTFEYVTYLGGRGEDIGIGIAVDSAGNAYVTGSTTSVDFPVTNGVLQGTYKGIGGNAYFPGGDAFVVKVNPTGTALSYSTYLGGSKDDWEPRSR